MPVSNHFRASALVFGLAFATNYDAHATDKPGWGPLSFGDSPAQVMATFPQCTRESDRMLKLAHYDYRTGKPNESSLWRAIFNFEGKALREVGLMLFGPPVHNEIDAEKEAQAIHIALMDRYGQPRIQQQSDGEFLFSWTAAWETERSHIVFNFTSVRSTTVNGTQVKSAVHRDEIKVTFTAPIAKGL